MSAPGEELTSLEQNLYVLTLTNVLKVKDCFNTTRELYEVETKANIKAI